ncbi:mucin-2-like [Trachinotus anak]|uniref:mucin-2-like n=1 Tax=Trachinotus anak TaxID=443729 RepID=UPI0039F1E86F
MRWRCVWLCFLALSVAIVTDVQARLVRNHVSSICSTWGSGHYKTFDGDVYEFPGMCEYNLASDCHETYREFSVHMKRKEQDGSTIVSYMVVTINDLSFHLSKSLITVNGLPVKLPYYNAGVQVEKNAVYIKLQSKVGITVMWNHDDAIMVELDRDYANRTCGLCGDFNGVSVYNEFIHNGRTISPIEFGNKQKVHRPNDDCEDPDEEEDDSREARSVPDSCKDFQTTCENRLHSESWSSCTKLIDPEPYIRSCVQDLCSCGNSTNESCLCSTLSEFSRQCSHAGGQPPNWRTPEFCAKKCPGNMLYEESGSPCMNTCTHLDTSSLCEDHKMDGCFCPPGTVYDDISERGCISQSECQCKHHNKTYNSNEVFRQDQAECTCSEGRWICKSLETPATCAVEEGSHITTFDGKTYIFHGDCYYTLAKVERKDNSSPNFTIIVQLQPCANQKFDTCLKSLKILLNNDRNNVLMFTSDGTIKQNMQAISLPYHSGEINIFQASSFHILLQTTFGLQIQIQQVPIMQVYVSLDQSYRAKTRGLCGNYNMVLSDDMKTPQGIVEGTAVTFVNSWKANHMCQDREERLEEPCSLSMDNEAYAKHWCSLLRSPSSTFAQCHSVVDPEMYYKRCTYATCNCEKSEACLCAVLSSYARACASKGVFLIDWRKNVCNKYTRNCPTSQTFSYKHQRCQLTCKSLGSKQQSCTSDFLPVDGCSCPDGLYLNEQGTCVPMAKCPCYYNEVYIKPGKSISIKDEHCVCTNGMLHCRSWRTHSSTCPSPKVFFNCSTAGKGELGVQCAPTCLNLDSDDCDSTECESGCQCPDGLIDDGKGACVKESDCPCQHDGHLYAQGKEIRYQCNNCTCKSGKWECTEKKCPGTCNIYGSGHYNTFDQRTYVFQGHCAYVAVKNKCGNKTAQDNFGVITENVPCGSTGTTCSKTVRIQLGRMEVKLSKGKYEEEDLGHGPYIPYRIRTVGLYLVIESAIGLAVMWDRRTNVRILLEPQHSGEVCGLCGDFNGDGQNDFTTQGQLVVSNPIEFGNSWKVSSTCPDVETNVDPCEKNPNRHYWAKMMCSIITGNTFKDCHNKENPRPYYENCVKDSCACDTGGDCECFCTAVAAYAQACSEAGVCVAWRTPEICPVFCDYYNSPGDCKWHYKPCHKPCYKTCLNPEGTCTNPLPQLEGCYPECPEDKPIFDEHKQICVEECEGCFYNGTRYNETEVIFNVTDNLGMCYYAICINATVIFGSESCSTSTPPPSTTITTTAHTTTPPETHSTTSPTTPPTTTVGPTTTTKSTTPPTKPTTTPEETSTTPCVIYCNWTKWYNVYDPETDQNDLETYENIKNSGEEICEKPLEIECRAADQPGMDFGDFVSQTGQVVTCDRDDGLICRRDHQIMPPFKCFDYEIKVCCPVYNCTTPPPPTPPTTTVGPTTTTESTTPPPPTTTVGPTTTTESTTTTPPTTPPTTTIGPTTTTTSTTSPTTPPSTTEETTTTSKSTTSPTTPPTTTVGPTTTTKSTTPPTTPPSTTQETTTTTKSTTPPTTPPSTTQETTTTPKSTTPLTTSPTTETPTTVSTTFTTTESIVTGPTVLTSTPLTGDQVVSNHTTVTSQTPPSTTTTQSSTTPTPTPTPTTTPTPTPTTTTTTTPSLPTCPQWNVTQNETFFLCNCTMARCIENNTIEIIPYECPPLENITCTNGKKPVVVYDEYHCCQYHACDCECKGWGDPHYITFDGLYYSYQGNCSYILMEEITPRHKLKIYIDNVNCDPTEDVSCPRAIIISYNSQVFKLINHNLVGTVQLEAQKNGVHLKLPYSQHDIKILDSGITLVLEIPKLKVVITFGLVGFGVNLPFEHFGKNTQGHCGTCNNNQADDCRLPGGQLVRSCAVMADYWLAEDISRPDCKMPPVLPTNRPEPPPTLTPCTPDNICDLLKSSVFAECHPFVSPDHFYQGCVFDSCHVSNSAVECISLETYAAACAQAGVCLHWRNHTTQCASDCPSNKVYKPCGPAEQPTCEDNPNESTMNFTTEGCFCPDGMKLFNKESGICVDKCGCLDPEGIPREFNESFEYKCQNCICEESTKTVTCKPKGCPAPPVVDCTGPGFVLVNQTNPSDPCCFAYVCQCQSNTCPANNMNCPVGYNPVVEVPEGKCCLEHTCEPKRVCVHKETEYQPGSSVPVNPCQDCTCTNEVDPKSRLFKIKCELQQCQKDCKPGYKYVEEDSDECCGKCVQTHCAFNLNGTTQLVNQGETWSPPDNKCERYICIKMGETLTTIRSHVVCPPFQESNCQPGTIQTAADGCCTVCVEKEKACKLLSMKTYVKYKKCRSNQEVEMPYCEGSCNTFTKYSEAAANMQHSCSCCKEIRSSRRTVDLLCLNGEVIQHSYMHVEECGCDHTECPRAAGQLTRRRRSFTLE